MFYLSFLFMILFVLSPFISVFLGCFNEDAILMESKTNPITIAPEKKIEKTEMRKDSVQISFKKDYSSNEDLYTFTFPTLNSNNLIIDDF